MAVVLPVGWATLSFLEVHHLNRPTLLSLQMMMKQQDQGLEMLGQSAERLSQISMGIHEELGHQNK